MDIKRYNNEKTFYPWSVVQALNSKSIENYCTKSEKEKNK